MAKAHVCERSQKGKRAWKEWREKEEGAGCIGGDKVRVHCDLLDLWMNRMETGSEVAKHGAKRSWVLCEDIHRKIRSLFHRGRLEADLVGEFGAAVTQTLDV